MRLVALLPLSLVLTGTACVPSVPPSTVLTPAIIASAPRYRLVYAAPNSGEVSPKLLQQVEFILQDELAARGYLLAAPWEEPTLEVHFTLTERSSFTTVMRAPVGEGECHTDTREPNGCAHSAWDNVLMSETARLEQYGLGVDLRPVGKTEPTWWNDWTLQGHWTPARPELNRSIVRLVLSTLEPTPKT
jgi:hypothetical protein